MESGNRRSARRRATRAALIACAVTLTVSGVALASLTQTRSSLPPLPPVVVVLSSAPHLTPKVSSEAVHIFRPDTNRTAVYVPPPVPSPPAAPPPAPAAAQQVLSAVEGPPPLLGDRGTVKAIAGTVKIRLKGTSTFASLSGSSSIPNGSELDATDGHVLITVATGHAGQTASAEVYGGVFAFRQTRGAHALTHFRLSLPLTGCSSNSPTGRPQAESLASRAEHRSGAKSRHLWVSEGGGSWGTGGRYVSTTVEGTSWLTLDECNRSVVEVAAGRVKVRDLVDGKTKVLTAGKTYVAAR